MIQLLKMAFRDLGRNRRRSFFSALAIAIGLGLLLLMASFLEGELGSALKLAIRLQTGHLQVRSAAYDDSKTSLKWEYLVEDPEQVAAQIAALAPVRLATPRLFASGILAVGGETAGVRVIGIDPLSEANAPYREGLVRGEFITPDDREGLLIGQPLADQLGLSVGDTVNLSINTANGDVDEQPFSVRGVYSTETNGFDTFTVFLPLSKAQAMGRAENHASTILVLLHDMNQTEAVANALQSPNFEVLTWMSMNQLLLETEELSSGFMVIFYMIVLGITATVVINTLIMSVFERTREIGILSAIGMKGRQILALFLAESSLLAIGGIVMGLVIGVTGIAILTHYGFNITQMGLTGILISNTLYPLLTVEDTITLTVLAFIVTLFAGLYPAIMAARMEPVEALRAEK